MSNILFANNASTTLAAPISSGATSATLATGTGSEFPNPSGGQYYLTTFITATTGANREIVKVTARAGDVITIVRAQEGTSPQAWSAGDRAANLLTVGSIALLQSGFPIATQIATGSASYTGSASGNYVIVNASGATVQTLPAASADSGMPIGFLALSACTITIPGGGGNFKGAALSGTSVSLAVGEFLCVQSDGSNWNVFSGSVNTLLGGAAALQTWVAANFLALTGGTLTGPGNLTVQGFLSVVGAASAASLATGPLSASSGSFSSLGVSGAISAASAVLGALTVSGATAMAAATVAAPATTDSSTRVPNTAWVRAALQQVAPVANNADFNLSSTSSSGIASVSLTCPSNGYVLVDGSINFALAAQAGSKVTGSLQINGATVDGNTDQTQLTQSFTGAGGFTAGSTVTVAVNVDAFAGSVAPLTQVGLHVRAFFLPAP